MNNYRMQHYPQNTAEPAVASFCDGELGSRVQLRRILSQLGLRADPEQEQTLLELIHRSCSRKLIA